MSIPLVRTTGPAAILVALAATIAPAATLHVPADAPTVQALPGAGEDLGGGLTVAMVRFGARFEYARTVEDVLARRSRLLFLDARRAIELAPAVARVLREELGTDPGLEAFLALAQQYLHAPA